MEKNRFAHPEAAADEPASPSSPDILGFDPAPLRYREDGLTPRKQRDYVEALADCGVARHAAARVGVSEQAINRVRRRADARAFDRACAAALRIGARRLVSVAFERAIEGTIKRHVYHGEIVSEERVYDNRLLMALIGKLPDLFEPGAEAVEADWQPWMDAVERGLPEPPRPEPEPELEPDEWAGGEVWEQDGELWTSFPPPAGFEGEEGKGAFGFGYARTLTPQERAVIDADEAAERAAETARRDRFFGFVADEGEEDEEDEEGEDEDAFFRPRGMKLMKLRRRRPPIAALSADSLTARPAGRLVSPSRTRPKPVLSACLQAVEGRPRRDALPRSRQSMATTARIRAIQA